MTVSVDFVSDLPDPSAYEALMAEYFAGIVAKLSAIGGPALAPQDLAADAVRKVGETLPPNGRLALATKDDRTLVGSGGLRRVRTDAAEMKRMYVRPEMQGQGIGRRLFEARVAAARAMGCRVIYADTVRGNNEMLHMYERFGFSHIPRYPENANPPELAPFLVFLEYRLEDAR